jgi:hypothetical protein
MWCRMLDIGVHHSCWLLLQALFITASVLTATSKTATRTITKGAFIGISAARAFPKPTPAAFSWFKMNTH